MPDQKGIDRVFKALADGRRREIFHLLMVTSTALSLSQITRQFDISRQGVTKHIGLLEEAGLVHISSQGREKFCEVDPTALDEIKDWLAVYEQFWDNKLKDLLDSLDGET